MSSSSGKTDARNRLTIAEIGWWSAAICVVLALPSWFGEPSIVVSFYGMIAFSAWRLSRYMPAMLAAFASVLIAIAMSMLIVFMVNR